MDLEPGITRAGAGLNAVTLERARPPILPQGRVADTFCFETFDPPGTFVPLHIHPTQDEFIYVLEGVFDLQLGDARLQAKPGDLVRMPRGLPHAYSNNQTVASRALFWVTPARRLRELFDQLHDLTDIDEAIRRSKACEVDFLPPP